MTKTELRAALARLSRYLLSRIAEAPAGVTTGALDDWYATVQRAKEGDPAALLSTRRLWDRITSTSAGRAALGHV